MGRAGAPASPWHPEPRVLCCRCCRAHPRLRTARMGRRAAVNRRPLRLAVLLVCCLLLSPPSCTAKARGRKGGAKKQAAGKGGGGRPTPGRQPVMQEMATLAPQSFKDFGQILEGRLFPLPAADVAYLEAIKLGHTFHAGQREPISIGMLYIAAKDGKDDPETMAVGLLLAAAGLSCVAIEPNLPAGQEPTALAVAAVHNQLALMETCFRAGASVSTVGTGGTLARELLGGAGNLVGLVPFLHGQAMMGQLSKDLLKRPFKPQPRPAAKSGQAAAAAAAELVVSGDGRADGWMGAWASLPRHAVMVDRCPSLAPLLLAAADPAKPGGATDQLAVWKVVAEWYAPYVATLLESCHGAATKGSCTQLLDGPIPGLAVLFQFGSLGGGLLHLLAAYGETELSAAWVSAGADPELQDLAGATPAVVAAKRGYFRFPGAASAAGLLGIGGLEGGRPMEFVQRKALPSRAEGRGGGGGGGGWDATPALLEGPGLGALDLGRCDVDELAAAPAPAVFATEYALAGRPLVIRQGCAGWKWTKRWQKAAFVKAHGRLKFKAADQPYKDNVTAGTAADGTAVETTLSEYLEMLQAQRNRLPPGPPIALPTMALIDVHAWGRSGTGELLCGGGGALIAWLGRAPCRMHYDGRLAVQAPPAVQALAADPPAAAVPSQERRRVGHAGSISPASVRL